MTETEIKFMSILDDLIVVGELESSMDTRNKYKGYCIKTFSKEECSSCVKYHVCSRLSGAQKRLDKIRKEAIEEGKEGV